MEEDLYGNQELGGFVCGIAEAAKKNIAQIMESIVTQQIWGFVMAPVFDSFGTNLTNAIAGGRRYYRCIR